MGSRAATRVPDRVTFGAHAAEGRSRSIQLPPLEFSKERSAAGAGQSAPGGSDSALRHTSLGWRIPAARHVSEDGYGPRLTPECVENSDSHRPTVHRPRRSPQDTLWVFGPPSSGRERPGLLTSRGESRGLAAVGWGDRPPNRSQRQPLTVHAVVDNSAHGWRPRCFGTKTQPTGRF